MIEINLLPEELRKRPTTRIDVPEIPAARIIRVGFIIFLVAQISLAGFLVYQKIEVQRLRKEYASLSAGAAEIIKFKSETDEMKARLKDIRVLTERKFYWALLLNALTDSVYKGVWLKSFVLGEGQESFLAKSLTNSKQSSDARPSSLSIKYLKLEASVMSQGAEPAAIGKFITQLKANATFSEIFSDVELSSIKQKKLKEMDVYDFVLICIFRNEKWAAA